MVFSTSATRSTTSAHTLSSHDSHVLSSILNLESLHTKTPVDFSLDPLPHIPPALLSTLQNREISVIKPLNNTSTPASDLQNAIVSLSELIAEHPQYASAYNNRAQAIRMLSGDDLRDEKVYRSTLWVDLGQAIELAAPPSPYAAVSLLQSKILASAYTHRGHIIWQLAKSMDPLSTSNPQRAAELEAQKTKFLPPQLQGKSKDQLEETASRDFEMGGRYGNDIAREMATRTNPYAKLCGNIVKEAMRGEMLEQG